VYLSQAQPNSIHPDTVPWKFSLHKELREIYQHTDCDIRIFIPVEDDRGDQYIWIVDKDNEGNVSRQKTLGVRYVPLTDAPR
jgi:hypothetical protein